MFNMINTGNKDPNSIEEICKATWKPLYRFIYFKVQNKEEAEDITQETFIKVFSRMRKHNIQPDEKFIAYLKTIALNLIIDRWRKTKRRQSNISIDAINPDKTAVSDPTESSIQRSAIENALSTLNEEQQAIINLRIIKGFSVTETAKILNKTEVNIRVLQYRAFKTLSKLLDESN